MNLMPALIVLPTAAAAVGRTIRAGIRFIGPPPPS